MIHTNLLIAAALALGANAAQNQIPVHPVDVNGGYLPRVETGLNTVTGPGGDDNAAAAGPTSAVLASAIRAPPAAGQATSFGAGAYSSVRAGGFGTNFGSVASHVATQLAPPVPVPAAGHSRHVVYVTVTTYYFAGYDTVEATAGNAAAAVTPAAVAGTSQFAPLESLASAANEAASGAVNDAGAVAESVIQSASSVGESIVSSAVSVANSAVSDIQSVYIAPAAANIANPVAPHQAPNAISADGAAKAVASPSPASASAESVSVAPAQASIPNAVASASAAFPLASTLVVKPATAAPQAEGTGSTGSGLGGLLGGLGGNGVNAGGAGGLLGGLGAGRASAAAPVGQDSVASASAAVVSNGAIEIQAHPVDINGGYLQRVESGANTVTGPALATGALM